MTDVLTIETTLIRISPHGPDAAHLAKAAAILQRGGLVAFPTETVYGLGADALNPRAVQRIFTAKERPSHDPLIVHIADLAQLDQVAQHISPLALQLAQRFWPGALTLILPKADIIPHIVTAGGPTVAVRCPDHPLALALIRAAGVPIAAPSANRFSHTSPTQAQHVLDDLAGRVELILDGGPTLIGVESTVLDVTGPEPRILRPGGVTAEELAAAIAAANGPAANLLTSHSVSAKAAATPLVSPGLLERHYAPHTPLWLFTQDDHDAVGANTLTANSAPNLEGWPEQTEMRQAMLDCAVAEQRKGGTPMLLLADEDMSWFASAGFSAISVGSMHDLAQVASQLFSVMRTIDSPPATLLLARDFPANGLGLAVRDRLRRAADRIINVSTDVTANVD